MRINSVRILALVTILLATYHVLAQAGLRDPGFLTDPALAKLVAAYNEEKDSRQWIKTSHEVAVLFQSESRANEHLAFSWIAQESGLTADDRRAFWGIAIRVAPASQGAIDARWAIRRQDLRAAPRNERLKIYRKAMETGSASLGEGVTVSRPEACGLAAFEGIEELEADVEKYAVERPTVPHGKAMLRTLLWFRRGAENEEDAVRLHLKRLAELPREEVSKRAASDEGFGGATEALKRDLDERRSPEMRDSLARALQPAFDSCEGERSRLHADLSKMSEGCRSLERVDLKFRAQQLKREDERRAGPTSQ